ncbi:hypothetical protein DFA_11821 [Cavenderia fasciculata]|uniref:Uncharacterized protein n=1 Tax=Cavenderia fasciculata TaxID=261658 RepID=F4QEB1_CACFS|nr:uncharacterized protein DFA_11821 [Cavenderia fasciculata]EGG14058.1 hypothetical protein DFA_11821 [Cavenderia fasciculata]|eukprot:XP_004350766.1 hypothetical protein DFA_11821 [Cavenderia fasciculata]
MFVLIDVNGSKGSFPKQVILTADPIPALDISNLGIFLLQPAICKDLCYFKNMRRSSLDKLLIAVKNALASGRGPSACTADLEEERNRTLFLLLFYLKLPTSISAIWVSI